MLAIESQKATEESENWLKNKDEYQLDSDSADVYNNKQINQL